MREDNFGDYKNIRWIWSEMLPKIQSITMMCRTNGRNSLRDFFFNISHSNFRLTAFSISLIFMFTVYRTLLHCGGLRVDWWRAVSKLCNAKKRKVQSAKCSMSPFNNRLCALHFFQIVNLLGTEIACWWVVHTFKLLNDKSHRVRASFLLFSYTRVEYE